MNTYKPIVSKDVTLTELKNKEIMNLMFLPENDGKFRESSKSSPLNKLKYITFLLTASEKYAQYAICYRGEEVGFILVAGVDHRLVGGILPEFQRKGIYGAARNAVIYEMNRKGLFHITSSVDKDNEGMQAFLATMHQTNLDGRLSVNHFNPLAPIAKVVHECTPVVNKVNIPYYHISFDDDLPETLTPKLPEGSDSEESGDYPEPPTSRISFSPSVELCFRAVYPNISHLLENSKEPNITFSVYVFYDKPIKLKPVDVEDVHDAGITLERITRVPTRIKKLGKVTIKNTSDDKGLFYLPKAYDASRYHSPLEITVDSKTF